MIKTYNSGTIWMSRSWRSAGTLLIDLFRWTIINASMCALLTLHDDVIKWKHFPRYWPFVRGIHRSPVNSPHKGQWRGALMFSLICVWINGWVNNRKAGDLRRHRAHYDDTVMWWEESIGDRAGPVNHEAFPWCHHITTPSQTSGKLITWNGYVFIFLVVSADYILAHQSTFCFAIWYKYFSFYWLSGETNESADIFSSWTCCP